MPEQAKETRGTEPQDARPKPASRRLKEFADRKAGDQGVVLQPVGSHETNPFTPQDNPLASPTTPRESSPHTPSPPSSSTGQDSAEGK
jgi:hypothetical protein